MSKFYNKDMSDLAHQLTMSPRRLRLEQIRGIDTLIGLTELDRSYPFDFVCYRITGFEKRGNDTSSSIPGKALVCDLVLLAEQLSRKSGLTVAELGEAYQTHQEVADRLSVSTKTIRRWRSRGLMGLRVVFPDGVNRLAFCTSTVDRFVSRNEALVAKGASFKQLTTTERDSIIDRAREIVSRRSAKLHAVAKMISAETGRAVETVRYTLRRYETSHGAVPIFANGPSSSVCERYASIWGCHEVGETAATIAQAFDCGVDEIQQVVRHVQIEKWRDARIECMSDELFDAPNADSIILDVPEPEGDSKALPKAPKGVPAYLQSLYRTPLLTREQEQDLFRRYNYLKHKARKALDAVDADTVSHEHLEAIRGWMRQYGLIRRRIISANLRLVVSIAKRHVGWCSNFYEVISDGNVSVMRAVEKFDYSRGTKFSTYATWAITKNFARSISEDHYHLRRFVTGQDEILGSVPDLSAAAGGDGDRKRVRELLSAGIRSLPSREREIVTHHFGLTPKGVSMTLEQLGRRFGVTKERIRQIEKLAMARLREVLSPSLAEAVAD